MINVNVTNEPERPALPLDTSPERVAEINAIAFGKSMALSEDVSLDPTIFNTKRDYSEGNGSLFLQDTPGLLDSINRTQPDIWSLYKKLKKLDWDENEFNYWECRPEFESGKKDEIDMMISTLAWQWEADSVAANNIVAIMAPFVSSSELWSAYVQIGQNEIVHGLTYSEIVRNSFSDSHEAMAKVLENVESMRRLETVGRMFAEGKRIGSKLTLGLIDRNSNEARDAAMKMVFAMLALERIQFMASFVITFAFGAAGRFMPICKAVQKICNEEFSIHVEVGKLVIANELKTKVGQESFERIKDEVKAIICEVTNSEIHWTKNHLFTNGRELPGCTSDMVVDSVLFAANDVFEVAGIENPYKVIKKNPVGYMEDWINPDKNQSSPQEERGGNYLLGGFLETAGDKKYSIAGL